MGFLDRVARPARVAASAAPAGVNGDELLRRAQQAHDRAEAEFDREPATKARLEQMYLSAGDVLAREGSPRQHQAWLGLATVCRYQKGRRADTLAAFDRALAAGPEETAVWEAYLDYVTFGVNAEVLLEVVRRIPPAIRLRHLEAVLAVARGRGRWGNMPSGDQEQFHAALPTLLSDDGPCLGAVLSEQGLHEHRTGSHERARQILQGAIGTGFPTVQAVDRLTIDLVKLGCYEEAHRALAAALDRPILSDTMRNKLAARQAKCLRALGTPGATAPPESPEQAEPVANGEAVDVRRLARGENLHVAECLWTAQIGWHDPTGTVDVDACALLLGPSRRVGGDADLVFYNQLTSVGGSVRHGGEQTLGTADLFEEVRIDVAALPESVSAVAVCASVHDGTFADVMGLHVRLEGRATLIFEPPSLTVERAVVLFEVYRRDGGWKVRAIGQGYADGLAGLARDFGVAVG